VQAHILGEVDILGSALLRVSSGTTLPIFFKSVHIWQTRSKISVGIVFWDTVNNTILTVRFIIFPTMVSILFR